MKVQITDSAKEMLFVAEMPAVRRIIQEQKEDEQTVEDYAKQAMHAFSNETFQIFNAKASIAKHAGTVDAFFNGSRSLDVWIEFIAFNSSCGVYEIGVYLTDIWSLSENNREEIRNRLYCNYFAPSNYFPNFPDMS